MPSQRKLKQSHLNVGLVPGEWQQVCESHVHATRRASGVQISPLTTYSLTMDAFDKEIAKAIELSLQEASPPKPRPLEPEYIVIEDSDEDDEEEKFQSQLQRAIEASKEDVSSPVTSIATSGQQTPAEAATIPSFISERAQMERERIARLKRLRPDFDVGADSRDDEPGAKSALSSTTDCNETHAQAGSKVAASGTPEALFWNGELRQTANMHVDPLKDTRPTFRLTEILSPKDDIEFAIISAYCINFPWIYSFFNPSTPVIVVAQDPNGQETIKTVLPNWVKTTPFLRNGMGCMHMKLFYKTGRVRIVVSTANLVEYDWRDIENSVWIQDLPKRPSPIAHDPKANDFAAAMVRVLHASESTDETIGDLRTHWDFTKVKVHLVPSIAGKHEGWPKVILSGHTALMRAVRDMGGRPDKGKDVVLECQGSSIGNYSTQWMNEFHCSARGDSAESWLDAPKSRRMKLPFPPVKILFPTAATVRESVLGEPGGGTMFCRRNQWQGAKFPRELFYQTKSKRGRVLMHSKMILATFRDSSNIFGHNRAASSDSETETEEEEEEEDNEPTTKLIGWVYVGSHNFTPSAWGTLSGSAFNPTLNIINYELGILLPLRTEDEANKIACWERPPKKYALGKDEPWMQSESLFFQS
ncbi:putative tyrosyl-DNA phosphodiesterase [Grifola frondosa]|uniref:Putative tyrosyl-DNA phosphodiesterase n=1 Tax=Grifola frondosa TaxID=5627 RepID=A0A1C7MBJ4_GRIFR|nr:putative tyrosyl-DNA phosphodiesterase [Grifola frondosa]